MDFVLFDHQLLLNRSNDIDYKEGIIKSTISLMNFLKKNCLIITIFNSYRFGVTFVRFVLK